MTANKVANNAKLTIVQQMYYQAAGEEPKSVQSRFCASVEGDGQPLIEHKQTATEQWQPIQTHWVDKVGQLCVKNDAPVRNVNPTDEERHSDEEQVLECGVEVHATCSNCKAQDIAVILTHYIRPGQSAQLEPGAIHCARIRCRKGAKKFTVSAFPK